jgi:hypothetical protein
MDKRRRWIAIPAVLAVLGFPSVAGAASGGGNRAASTFAFGAFGDQGYTAAQRAAFPGLVARMNAANLAFSVHDGDIGADPEDCNDAYLRRTRDTFDTFTAPLVYTPGDNEWIDCRDEGFDPYARLASLRRLFFATNRSRGRRTLTVEQQLPGYPENARWAYGGVTFATVHVVGSNDGSGADSKANTEFAARRAADVTWLNQAFDAARAAASRGIVIVWQADPFFGRDIPAFQSILRTLRQRTIAFAKPVLLIHGDSHYCYVDKPLVDDKGRPVQNLTRLETYGPNDLNWTPVTVAPAAPKDFQIPPCQR